MCFCGKKPENAILLPCLHRFCGEHVTALTEETQDNIVCPFCGESCDVSMAETDQTCSSTSSEDFVERPASVSPTFDMNGKQVNKACFCGEHPQQTVLLSCNHRFCAEHLTELRERSGLLLEIVCPYCGERSNQVECE